jgi:hypothetical protein
MTVTFGDAIRERTLIQHQLAIYEELLEHLEQFLPDEVDEELVELPVDDCIVPIVAEESFVSVGMVLEEHLNDLRTKLKALEESTLNGRERNRSSVRPAGTRVIQRSNRRGDTGDERHEG